MLKGERVVLTELRSHDSDVLFSWINDAETVRFNAPYAVVSRTAHEQWFANLGKDPKRIAMAIRENRDAAAIGVVQLVDIHSVHRSAELIIRIGAEESRNRGHGTDAVRIAVAHAFNDLNLQRVWLRVFATNARAISAYKKAGFVEEGVMQRACFIHGAWVDETIMAILRE